MRRPPGTGSPPRRAARARPPEASKASLSGSSGELVAADARDDLARARAGRQAPGGLGQHLVAGLVPEAVVDRLKWSRSKRASASGRPWRRARSTSAASRSWKARWLASPVSGSLDARIASCARASALTTARPASSANSPRLSSAPARTSRRRRWPPRSPPKAPPRPDGGADARVDAAGRLLAREHEAVDARGPPGAEDAPGGALVGELEDVVDLEAQRRRLPGADDAGVAVALVAQDECRRRPAGCPPPRGRRARRRPRAAPRRRPSWRPAAARPARPRRGRRTGRARPSRGWRW